MFATVSPLRDRGHSAFFPAVPSLELQLVLKDMDQLLLASPCTPPPAGNLPGNLPGTLARRLSFSSSYQADPMASYDVLTALASMMLNLDSSPGQGVPVSEAVIPRASSFSGLTAVPSPFVPTSPSSVGRDDQLQLSARSLSAIMPRQHASPGQDQKYRQVCMSAEPRPSPNPLPPISALLGGFAAPKASVTSSKAHHPLYKTELCRSWEQASCCQYGDRCQFAHGCAELRQVQRHPKYKTKVCQTFLSTGICPYGNRCRFVHSSAAPTL